jgi:hypothetical protein
MAAQIRLVELSRAVLNVYAGPLFGVKEITDTAMR